MEECKDLYQTVMVIFYENIVDGKLKELNSSIKTYLFAIGKNKCRELKRAKARNIPNVQDYLLVGEGMSKEEYEIYESKMTSVEHALNMMDSKCSELLDRFYYKKQSMSEISEAMEYKNQATAKNMKYKCLQRLKSMIASKKTNPLKLT
ncbi:MAG: sigma-70 family RNA polymerase sigma factor [Bacteroidota bacterium]